MKQFLVLCAIVLLAASLPSCGGGSGAESSDEDGAVESTGLNNATSVNGTLFASNGSPLVSALVYIPLSTSEDISTSITSSHIKTNDECGTPLVTACASACTDSEGFFSLDVSECTGAEAILMVLKDSYTFSLTLQCSGNASCEMGSFTSTIEDTLDDDTLTNDPVAPDDGDNSNDSESYYSLETLSAYNGLYLKHSDGCSLQSSWGAWGCDGGSVAYFPFSNSISVSVFQSSSFSLRNSALASFDSGAVSNPSFSQYSGDYPIYNASYFIGDYSCVEGELFSRGLSGSGIADAAIASYVANCSFMPFTYHSGDSSTDWLVGSCARQNQTVCKVYFYK